jgi:dUTP pyrophosphatase
MNKLKIYCKDENCKPVRAHPTDAGIDLRAAERQLISTTNTLVKTGVHVEIPEGYVGLVAIRSGLSKEGFSLTNGVGIIDSDYRGEIMCSMRYNTLYKAYKDIEQYQRIAQLIVVPCLIADEFVENLEDLSDTDRGEGGFGHTGKH